MSTQQRGSDGPRVPVKKIAFPDFEISWAGECPWLPAYCLGSEDGQVRFVNPEGEPISEIFEISPSGEAVNGVAFFEEQMAVSTRSDVTFFNVPLPGDVKVERGVFYGGAFDVVAMPRGGFLAPLGRNGIIVAGKKQGIAQNVSTIRAGGQGLNAYKLAVLGREPGGEVVLACASRKDGFAVLTLGPNWSPTHGKRLHSPGVDFVDVCSLQSEDRPFAAAALGLDGSILLTTDVLRDPTPKTLRYQGIQGRPYRIYSHQGHIVMLTSECLYAIRDVASDFLMSERIGGPTKAVWLEMEAVDAELCSDGNLLIVMPDSVYKIGLYAMGAHNTSPGMFPAMRESDSNNGKSIMAEISEESWGDETEDVWVESKGIQLAVA